MKLGNSRGAVGAIILAASLAAMTACGSANGSGSSNAPSPTVSKDAELAAELPAKIKEAGKISVATDPSSPPMEFFASDGKTLQGFDFDLGEAIGQVLGVDVTWTTLASAGIIPALQNGRFDMALTSAEDLPERRAVFGFVDYFQLGSQIVVKAGDGEKFTDFTSLCGHSVGVQAGTSQFIAATAQQKNCGSSKIDIQAFPDNNASYLALNSGRVEAVYVQTINAAYVSSKSPGQYDVLPDVYGTTLVGAAFPLDSGLVDVVQKAVQSLIDDGTYGQLLEKWKLENGAVEKATINGGQ